MHCHFHISFNVSNAKAHKIKNVLYFVLYIDDIFHKNCYIFPYRDERERAAMACLMPHEQAVQWGGHGHGKW